MTGLASSASVSGTLFFSAAACVFAAPFWTSGWMSTGSGISTSGAGAGLTVMAKSANDFGASSSAGSTHSRCIGLGLGLGLAGASTPRLARSAAACCAIILDRSSSAFFIAARCVRFASNSAFSAAIFSRHLRLLSAKNFLTSARRFSVSSGFLLCAASSPAGFFPGWDPRAGSSGIVAPHAGLDLRSTLFAAVLCESAAFRSRSRRSRSSQKDGRMFSLHGRSPSHGFCDASASSSSSTTLAGTAVGVAASSFESDDEFGGLKTVPWDGDRPSGAMCSLARLMRDSFCFATVWRSSWTAFCRRMSSSASRAAASLRASISFMASLGGVSFLSKPSERGEFPKPRRAPSSLEESSLPRSSSPACCDMSRRSCARASACEGPASSSSDATNPPDEEATGATTTFMGRSLMPARSPLLADPLPACLARGVARWSAGRSAPVAAARVDPSTSPTSLEAARLAISAICFTRAMDSERCGSSSEDDDAGAFPVPPLDAIADVAEYLAAPRTTSILRRRVDRPLVESSASAIWALDRP